MRTKQVSDHSQACDHSGTQVMDGSQTESKARAVVVDFVFFTSIPNNEFTFIELVGKVPNDEFTFIKRVTEDWAIHTPERYSLFNTTAKYW